MRKAEGSSADPVGTGLACGHAHRGRSVSKGQSSCGSGGTPAVPAGASQGAARAGGRAQCSHAGWLGRPGRQPAPCLPCPWRLAALEAVTSRRRERRWQAHRQVAAWPAQTGQGRPGAARPAWVWPQTPGRWPGTTPGAASAGPTAAAGGTGGAQVAVAAWAARQRQLHEKGRGAGTALHNRTRPAGSWLEAVHAPRGVAHPV